MKKAIFVFLCISFLFLFSCEKTEKETFVFSTEEKTAPEISREAATEEKTEEKTAPFEFEKSDENEITELLSSYSGNVSVIYHDIISGYTYEYNSDKSYFAASVIKAPFCLYVSKLIDEGKADGNMKLKYTSDFKVGGTGVLKNTEFGKEYTVNELLSFAIRKSDNSAFKMLRSVFLPTDFTEFAENLGINDVSGIKNVNNSTLSAKDALVYFSAIYSFISEGSDAGIALRENMLNTTNKMIESKYPIVRKYGWADKSFHDCAIICAERPYILIILSDHEDGTKADFRMFSDISLKIEDIYEKNIDKPKKC